MRRLEGMSPHASPYANEPLIVETLDESSLQVNAGAGGRKSTSAAVVLDLRIGESEL